MRAGRIGRVTAGPTACHGLLAARNRINQLVRHRLTGRVFGGDRLIGIDTARCVRPGQRRTDTPVAFLQGRGIGVQAVGIGHAAFPCAEQPSHHAFLTPELLPGLVKHDGKLPV